MTTHLSVPKVSVTSTDSGYDSKKQSKSNILHENDDLANKDTTERSKEVVNPPQSLTLPSLYDNEHERHRASSTGSNVSSYSSDVSTPGSTKPLLSDKSTTKSRGQDHHLLSPHDYVQGPHCIRKISTGSNAPSCCSSDPSTPGSTKALLSDQSTSKPKGQTSQLLSPNDYVQEPHRSRKTSTSSSYYSSDVSTPGSTRSSTPVQSTAESKEQNISKQLDENRQQDAEQQKSSSAEMTSADERILRNTVRHEMPRFVNNTDCKALVSHMYSRSLLHPSDYETLNSMPSNVQRGNHLYMQILPHKGEHAYRLLYECLEGEKEHCGHADLVNILDKALKDRHPPQSGDTSLTKLNYADEIILGESVCCETPTFIKHSDFSTLFSHLYSRKLVNSNDYETLTSMQSDMERGNHLYMQILPRKGRQAYRRLYKCLKNEREHVGHRDLVKILDRALRDRSRIPTAEDDRPEESSTPSQAKVRIRCCVQ